jgi:hypothetical protein
VPLTDEDIRAIGSFLSDREHMPTDRLAQKYGLFRHECYSLARMLRHIGVDVPQKCASHERGERRDDAEAA